MADAKKCDFTGEYYEESDVCPGEYEIRIHKKDKDGGGYKEKDKAA